MPGSPRYASLPGCSCQQALEGSGRHGRGRLCLLSAPVHAAAAAGQPSAAAATASASSGDPRASLGAPTGTPLKFSDVSNSQAMSFPQSLGPSPAGPSSECLGSDHPTASLCPGPRRGAASCSYFNHFCVPQTLSLQSPIRKYLALCLL